MSKVEKRSPSAGFAFVLFDDPRLSGNREGDRMLALDTICSPSTSAILLKPAKELAIFYQCVFGDLGIARAELTGIEREQERGIDEHQRGLVKCTHQILSSLHIDRRLAADRAVDLGKQESSGFERSCSHD